ncbi:hypothetical protein [Aquimarina spongiae]|uniref:Viral A-type inclusion protein n=1 Tax=Aquimarina spongiae TaxID=570521 RepID=A0A1M6CTR4_9FLAO|nr:hypothetical protein [Aquimarina spongiae]SHI64366.1 hypothetical protein SAMN04488508_102273 [Aquimarina spongiae]
MKLRIFYSLILSVLLFSCNQLSKEEQEFDALMQKVIDVHDEVMPKMGEMSSLIKELEAKVDTTAQGQNYAKAQQDVKDAYDYMMSWMGNFSDSFPHDETNDSADPEKLAAKFKLLQEEEVKVEKLRDQINASIKNAKAILQKP